MLASSKVMDTLKSIGLNLYERKLWVALLAKGTATAGELSEIGNVPRSRTYDVLQTLAEKGFVVIQPFKPLKYLAISPDDALKKAKEKLKQDLKTKIERIENIENSEILVELEKIHKGGLQLVSPGDLTGAFKGRYAVIQQMESMLRSANSSVDIVTTPAGLNELFENHISLLKKLKENGVEIKIASRLDGSSVNALKALSNIAEIRNITESELPLSGKFCVIDAKEMMMGLSDPDSVHSTQELMFWTKSQYAAKSVVKPLFDLVWERTAPSTEKKSS